jgi:hypothetical protein
METDRAKRRALSYSIRKGVRWESSLSDFQHQSLETLVIFGFLSDDYMVRYIRRVMETAVNLEDVFLYDRLACIKCRDNPPPSNFPSTESEKLSVEEKITRGVGSSAAVQFPSGKAIRDSHLSKKNFP